MLYHDIPHENYDINSVSNLVIPYIYLNEWKSSGFWILCLLLDNINLIEELNIFGLDFGLNKYSKVYNKNEVIDNNIKTELHVICAIIRETSKNNKNIIIHDKGFNDFIYKM